MANPKQVAVRIDNKGRVTLPKKIREALGVDSGDTVFLKYEPENRQVRLAPALNPFDVLAEHAIEEYRAGRTRTVEEFAKEHDITKSINAESARNIEISPDRKTASGVE